MLFKLLAENLLGDAFATAEESILHQSPTFGGELLIAAEHPEFGGSRDTRGSGISPRAIPRRASRISWQEAR